MVCSHDCLLAFAIFVTLLNCITALILSIHQILHRYARHVLNAESPLLKWDIRDSIVHGGGKWNRGTYPLFSPFESHNMLKTEILHLTHITDYNNWEVMRDCLNEFTSLRITLSGTSAESASTVFGEHVYEFDDVCVGWR